MLKLEIDDLGPIRKAEININQINVIGGPNSGGKTISSKLLYSFLSPISKEYDSSNHEKCIEELIESEFGSSNLGLFENSHIGLKEDFFEVQMKDSDITFKKEDRFDYPFDRIIYMDSFSLLYFKFDNGEFRIDRQSIPSHFYHLMDRLKTSERKSRKKQESFAKELKDIMGGEFVFDDESGRFKFNSKKSQYDMFNIASGYRQLGLLQLLLSNNCLKERTFLIIDEPELNLHPSFEVKLGELFIKMAKELNIHIYINTHSAYIIESLDVYSKIEKMTDRINFILCEEEGSDKDSLFNIYTIKQDDIEDIYDNLSYPYKKLNSLRIGLLWDENFD